jgi:hypothetical protein
MSDFFRDFQVSLKRSHWLNDLFKYQLKKVTGIETEVMLADEISRKMFSNCLNTYFDSNIDWISLFNFSAEDFPTQFLDDFLKYVGNDSIIIAFELPNCLINLFNKYNISYITVMHHPIRFLNDILLGFQTNIKDIHIQLKKYEVNTDLFYIIANKYVAEQHRQDMNFDYNSILLCGQTEKDRSLIDENQNHFLSFNDYESEILQILSNYKTVYFKKHPCNQEKYNILKKL